MGLLAVASAHKVATAVLVVAVVAGGVNAATSDAVTATVTDVVDGDTIDVSYDGATHRVRLLNVDTPESVDPDKPVECLALEASEYLAGQLPVGTGVRLEHDQDEHDRYGRELAAVFRDDVLINAEIARAGFGVAMSVGRNDEYLPPVRMAQAEAQATGRGLHAASPECTVPAQISALEAAATAVVSPTPAPAELADLDSHAGELVAVAATATSVARLLGGAADVFPMVAHSPAQVVMMKSRVRSVQSQLAMAQASNRTARAAEQRRVNDAREAAEAAARRAAEEAAARAAAETARQAREAAAEAARQAAAEAASRRTPTPQPSSTGSSGTSRTTTPQPAPTAAPPASDDDPGSGSSGGYTGCRSYAPGGRTWTPIDC